MSHLVEKVARTMAKQGGTSPEENAREVLAIVMKELKEHYRKSAIPKWDIQFLEKYAQQEGIEL